ncbi:MAG: LodA/GoxA family CTQ-dependent oxidase [Archangium sp.]|nr:LodA/GoxA family CTQ-dependent oxidase [Archangium sp.]
MSRFQIYPPIGVARVGNSPESFPGPQHPGVPANWDAEARRFLAFKDLQGRVKRQAAVFRVAEVDEGGQFVRFVTSGVSWRVHVANRKAAFFTFNGPSGVGRDGKPPYAERSDAQHPATAVEKENRGRGAPQRFNMRDALVADRASLVIDPGEVLVPQTGAVEFRVAQPRTPISYLGEASMDSSGSLLVLGGVGASGTNGGAPIDEYANNDGWFDDVGDGPVRATVTLPSGEQVEAEQAWVIVGPPDFAPGLTNMVTLYDTLSDLVIRTGLPIAAGGDPDLLDLEVQQRAWWAPTNDFDETFTPSFTKHVYPMLARGLGARDVHEFPSRPGFHGSLANWPRLSSPDEAQARAAVFSRVRDPNALTPDWKGMPRGLGDEFPSLDRFEELTEAGNDVEFTTPKAFLSFTPVQYAILKKWLEGKFVSDWAHGDVKYEPIPTPPESVTPHGLTRAALESCVGGPFMPGIEVGWLVREAALYERAFRLKPVGLALGPLTLDAGFFSQQMAQPWHADFYDCHKEDHTPDGEVDPLVYMWWTTIRPDDIRASADGPYRRWVLPFDAAKDADVEDADDIRNLARFEQMRTRWHLLSFVVLEGDEHVEQK